MLINDMGAVMNGAQQIGGMQGGQRPPGPPPGQTPPGLENAVETLSESEQAEVKSMLESFSPEQHDQLKAKLDEFKSSASSMSEADIGAAFYHMLIEVSGQETTSTAQRENSSVSKFHVDTYA